MRATPAATPAASQKRTQYPAVYSTSIYPTMAMQYPGQPSVWYPQVGVTDFLSAFSAEKWRGEIATAQKASMLKRIVKKKIVDPGDAGHAKAQHKTKTGKPLLVEPYPFFARSALLREYGCPVAVNLYLQFLAECAALFLLMFLLSIPDLVRNIKASDARAACRAYTDTPDEYAAITGAAAAAVVGGVNLTADALSLGCGWDALSVPIRHNLTAPVWYLRWAVGTCQEYADVPNRAELQPVSSAATPFFVETPSADYCIPGSEATLSSAAYWLQFVNCILFFLFLMRLRRNQRCASGGGPHP
jgi:hypothetical protein